MAPWGGKKALLGLNPIAIAAPIAGQHPFMIDMATTVVAMGKVTKAADLGQSIPEGWALDVEGNLTTDPKAASRGTLFPIGAYKGYGLAMAMEMLTAVLGGGQSSPQIKSWIQQTVAPMGASFMVMAIDIARFQDPQAFKDRMRDWTALLTGSPRREGVERIYYPGEMEGEAYAERARSGIPVDDRTAAMLAGLAERFAPDAPWKGGV
jgi:LDH2 family malate/lactate/ureidoglycolate dehydrogenase